MRKRSIFSGTVAGLGSIAVSILTVVALGGPDGPSTARAVSSASSNVPAPFARKAEGGSHPSLGGGSDFLGGGSDLDPGYMSASARVLKLRGSGDHAMFGIVVANGADWSPQPVTMFAFKRGQPPGPFPTWVSLDHGYHTGVCVGDLDKDGNDDAVVTVLGDALGNPEGGGVKVYYGTGSHNEEEGLEPEPVWLFPAGPPPRAGRGAGASACAIADVNGDGFDDVVLATAFEAEEEVSRRPRRHALSPIVTTKGQPKRPIAASIALISEFNGTARLLLNPGRPRRPFITDPWRPGPLPQGVCGSGNLAPGAVTFLAHGSSDGYGAASSRAGDLVFAGRRLAIYRAIQKNGKTSYSTAPDWYSKEEFPYSPSVDVIYSPQRNGPIIAVAKTCGNLDKSCCEKVGPSSFLVYDPTRPMPSADGALPIWRHDLADGGLAGPVKLIDLESETGDSLPDLVASIYKSPASGDCEFGGALMRFVGKAQPDHPFDDSGSLWHPGYKTVVGSMESARIYRGDCDDLIVVSSSPLKATTILPGIGKCSHP